METVQQLAQQPTGQLVVQSSQQSQPHDLSWYGVRDDLKAGAWSLSLFLILLIAIAWRGLATPFKEALAKHFELMHSLTESSRMNAETLRRNARTLQKLSEANSRVAQIMASELELQDRKNLIIKEITGSLNECRDGSNNDDDV